MRVMICPMCDSEMSKMHYCDTCHSFILKPEIMDVHYNAGSRGRGEEDCAYGEEHDRTDHGNSPWDTDGQTRTFWEEHRRQQEHFEKKTKGAKKKAAPTAADDHAEVFGSGQAKKPKSRIGCLSGCFTIIFILFFLGGIIGSLLEFFENL